MEISAIVWGLRRTACAAWLATLVGCASTNGPVAYPPDWPALRTDMVAQGCPDVSGTYANEASAAYPPTSVAPRLTEVFTRMGLGPRLLDASHARAPWNVPQRASAVRLQLAPDHLQLRFVDPPAPEAALAFRRYRFDWQEKRYDDLFTCYATGDAPRLRFFAEPASHSEVMPWFFIEGGGTLVFLLKASDGSLVVQWRAESLLVTSVLAGSRMRFDSVWWRYPPVDATR